MEDRCLSISLIPCNLCCPFGKDISHEAAVEKVFLVDQLRAPGSGVDLKDLLLLGNGLAGKVGGAEGDYDKWDLVHIHEFKHPAYSCLWIATLVVFYYHL